MTIKFILTGGTIDSYFDPKVDSITIGGKTVVKDYIESLQLHDSVDFEVVVLKDSREIRYKDRQKILEAIKNSKNERIIVTHGTYTMPDAAQYLKDHLPKDHGKVIVFTGSMVPLKGFYPSDAAFNLGYAIAKVQILEPGVYLCMNGKVFEPNEVDKNRIKGRFEKMGELGGESYSY